MSQSDPALVLKSTKETKVKATSKVQERQKRKKEKSNFLTRMCPKGTTTGRFPAYILQRRRVVLEALGSRGEQKGRKKKTLYHTVYSALGELIFFPGTIKTKSPDTVTKFSLTGRIRNRHGERERLKRN